MSSGISGSTTKPTNSNSIGTSKSTNNSNHTAPTVNKTSPSTIEHSQQWKTMPKGSKKIVAPSKKYFSGEVSNSSVGGKGCCGDGGGGIDSGSIGEHMAMGKRESTCSTSSLLRRHSSKHGTENVQNNVKQGVKSSSSLAAAAAAVAATAVAATATAATTVGAASLVESRSDNAVRKSQKKNKRLSKSSMKT
ncbi:hypothetical protein ElyMa_003368400 [Elysia marginata]|uniref:Uncharacterized protein n=1 Tax=Elysia marginata TaxID=1093978 RepID=A0AAV4JMK2_9GAST|nr:hypothetical protein ElyMa_003368400 [Elysia marginata]